MTIQEAGPSANPAGARRADRVGQPTGRPPRRWVAWMQVTVAGLLPGALAGIQLAGLLFFLNPDLPFTPGPFVRASLVYSSLLGLASVALHLPIVRRRPRLAWRFLPWALSIVFSVAATAAWFNASHFAYYLPGGINRRLVKAAIWLSLAALISFYTALLHRLQHRAYTPRSRFGLALLTALSIYVVLERREAFRPFTGPGPRPSAVESTSRPHLLVVGLECATLDAILPLAEQGHLPFFSSLLQQGVRAHLSSLRPTRRGPLWTTLATGKFPFQHGIVDDRLYDAAFLDSSFQLRLLPSGLGFRYWGVRREGPSAGYGQRRTLALWEILSRLGVATTVVGWPIPETRLDETGLVAAYPEAFFSPRQSSDASDWTADLLRTAQGVARATLSTLGSERTAELAPILAQDLWRASLAEALLAPAATPAPEEERAGRPPTEALFVNLPGLRSLSQRYFGGYSAVQFDGRQGERYRRAAETLTTYYVQLDSTIEQLWAQLEPPRLLAVVSAYGVRPPTGLQKIWAVISRRRRVEGYSQRGPDGLLLLLGEGIESGAFLNRAGLTDLAPTLLYGLGLPIARDFDGRVLTEAFERSYLARTPLTFVPSFETLMSR